MSRRTSIVIHVILAALLLTPLHYYLYNTDKRDERFAWRMFSPVRVESCGTQFFVGVDPKPIKTSSKFHNAWAGIAQRGWQQAISVMTQRLCDDNPETPVRVRILCEQFPQSTADNRQLLYDPKRTESDERVQLVARGLFNFCETGSL